MVREGHGLGVLNRLAARMIRTDGLRARVLAEDSMQREVAVWWHTDQPVSTSVRTFVELASTAPAPAGTQTCRKR